MGNTEHLPPLTPVASSAIRSVGYQPLAPEIRKALAGAADGFTLIKFVSGDTYAYLTPSWLYGLLRAHRSAGRGFHALVRGKYPAVRVPVAQDGAR